MAPALLRVFQTSKYFRDVHDHLQSIIGRSMRCATATATAIRRTSQCDHRTERSVQAVDGVGCDLCGGNGLAGIWGMNFNHMPELDWTLGYPAALGVMLLVALLLYRRFRKAGWI
jgi:magnesium transporter